jgi:GntR family transcriptional regulator
MRFQLEPGGGQPLYLQLIQQVRHAVETGVLQDGDPLPSIRALAEQLVVSHNTVAKAYTELAREGLLDLRHGAGAFITARRSVRSRAELFKHLQERVRELVRALRDEGLSDEQIRRAFEAELRPQSRARGA